MPDSKIVGAVTATAVIVRCNTRTEAPWKVVVDFDKDFIPGGIDQEGASAMIGVGMQKNGHACTVQMGSPPLLAERLLILTVYGPTKEYQRALTTSVEPVQ